MDSTAVVLGARGSMADTADSTVDSTVELTDFTVDFDTSAAATATPATDIIPGATQVGGVILITPTLTIITRIRATPTRPHTMVMFLPRHLRL